MQSLNQSRLGRFSRACGILPIDYESWLAISMICSFVLIGRPEHFGSIMTSQSPVRLLNLSLKLRLFTQIMELGMVIGLSRVQLSLL